MLKRDGRLFLRGLIPALVLTLLLFVACALASLSASIGAEAKQEPVKVALVDEEDSVLSRISITMVKGQSYMASIMDIDDVSYDEAVEGIAEGRFGAAVILPDGYMDAIMHGQKMKGRIIISDSFESNKEIIGAVADFGERLLSAGQIGVFAGEQVVSHASLSSETYDYFIENSNANLINFALDAYDKTFTFEELPYSDTDISLADYYIACWMTLLLFVCGLFFPDLYTADCKGSLYARLRTKRIGMLSFLAGKLIYPFLFRCLIAVPLIFLYSAKAYFVAVLTSALITIITSCTALSLSKKGGWVVLILGVSSACLFMAGGMIPRTMLPEFMPKFVSFTPYGGALNLMIAVFGGSYSTFPVIILSIYSAITLWAALHFLNRFDIGNEEVRL